MQALITLHSSGSPWPGAHAGPGREVIKTSKPIKDVATAYGVGPETLRNWLIKYCEANGGTEADLTVSERARLKELEREVQELRAETAFMEKASAYFAREQR